jgi:hypothetical protein
MSEYHLSELGSDWTISRKIRQSRYERVALRYRATLEKVTVDVQPFAVRLALRVSPRDEPESTWVVEFTDVSHWEYRRQGQGNGRPGFVVAAASDAPIWSIATDAGEFLFVSALTARARPAS